MTHLNIADVDYFLPDGRQLLSGVSFRVGNGAKTALIGPNGTGKTTLLRIVAGDVVADEGAVTRSGTLGVMRQFVGQVRDESTVRDLLLSVSPARIRDAALALDTAENAMIERDEESTQMKYSHALADWADVGGYETEDFWDKVTTAALGVPYDRAKWRAANSLSGGEQKRLVLEALFAGPDDALLLDEPDNYLDVPGKRWLEKTISESSKVVFVRQPRPRTDRQRGHPHRDARARNQRRNVVDARRWAGQLPPGPRGSQRSIRRTASTLGRGAREITCPGSAIA